MDRFPSLPSLSQSSDVRQPRFRGFPAWSIPLGVIVAFAVLFLTLFRDRLIPASEIEVARVLVAPSDQTADADSHQVSTTGSLLFQASGWIEPDPHAVIVPALIDGVVDVVHVREGQRVIKGEQLITLVSEDARLALASVEQQAEISRSQRDAHQGAIASAREKLLGAEAQATAAAAVRDEAADRLKRFESLSDGSIAELEVVAARLRLAAEESRLLAVTSETNEAAAEIKRLELELRVREDQIQSADLEVEKARLALSRTMIAAPINGRILRVTAVPGQKKMLQSDEADSSTVAVLYDPASLQVRVDIPLADAAGVHIGQATRIQCGLLSDQVFKGAVTRVAGEADLQRNTLQVKVRIADPAEAFRPDMLCRVEFLETRAEEPSAMASSRSSFTWIPTSAVKDGVVWICDPDSKRISRREIQITRETRDGFTRVLEGAMPGEWVVLSPGDLEEDQRITPKFSQP